MGSLDQLIFITPGGSTATLTLKRLKRHQKHLAKSVPSGRTSIFKTTFKWPFLSYSPYRNVRSFLLT